MTIGARIKSIREKLNLSQVELADKINVSKQTLYKYENDIITNIPSDKIEAIASLASISPAYIMGWDVSLGASSIPNSKRKHTAVVINVLGRVAAGIPLEAVEDIIDTEEITEEMASTGEFFGLKIQGDSMEPKISNGDVVIVRQQNDADSEDIVIAMVNGNDAVCKRLKKYAGGIMLLSNNPKYDPMIFTDKEIEELPVRIIGRVMELRAKF